MDSTVTGANGGKILPECPREAVLERAIALVARSRLRGADAVYGAVAQHYGTTLVTLDRQQLERLPPEVRTGRPAELLRQLQSGL